MTTFRNGVNANPQPNQERSRRTEPDLAPAEEREPDFNLPWRLSEFGDIITSVGDVILDPFAMTVSYHSPEAEGQYLRRIIACVNACAGIATEDLESGDVLATYYRYRPAVRQ